MKELVPHILQVSLILLMASIGMRAHWRDLTSILKQPGLLLRAVVAVNVVVPLAAVIMVLVLPMEPAIKVGIVAMAFSPMAPFLPGKMLKAGVERSFAVGLYVALVVFAIILVPLSVALLGQFVPRGATLPFDAVAKLMATSVLAPLAVGLLIGSFAPSLAKRLAKPANILAMLGLLIVLVLILIASVSQVVALVGDGTLLAIVVVVAAGLAAGHLLGGPDTPGRMALAFAASARHPGIAVLIVRHNYNEQKAVLAVVLFLLVSIVVSTLYQRWAIGRSSAAVAETSPG